MIQLATDDNMGLTSHQVEVLESLCLTGCVNDTAAELKLNRATVTMHVVRACRIAGVKNRGLLMLKWDRFKNQPKGPEHG